MGGCKGNDEGEKRGRRERWRHVACLYYLNIIGTTGSTYVNVRITYVIFCTSKRTIK